MPQITGVNHITLAVSHLERSFRFYTDLLELTPHVRWDAGAYLTSGDLWICLSCDNSEPARDYTHIAFNVGQSSFDQVAHRLRNAAVIEWKDNHSEGQSIYFLDPDGHKLEVHSGTLQDRLQSLQHSPYAGLQWC
jgi:catechol 2,3-dioxygenase-like lactoylglutathione lyase family enzyme